jgi:hypothetical protein
MRIPVNLLVFLAVAGVFYLYILPKKAAFTKNLLESMGAGHVSREDSVKTMVKARILVDICPMADLSEYHPVQWSDYGEVDGTTSQVIHEFTCDAQNRKYLFRLRGGLVSEIIDLR